ncbi:hypothetical protein [Teredinibacter purpureus]|uniref:hypothetical protein n=1 Tax=Teredinibacter purpureus TaxID=2731756 RepID=UPI0013C475D4|nr:hypothetical protein [Teredinibacter purpureus]
MSNPHVSLEGFANFIAYVFVFSAVFSAAIFLDIDLLPDSPALRFIIFIIISSPLSIKINSLFSKKRERKTTLQVNSDSSLDLALGKIKENGRARLLYSPIWRVHTHNDIWRKSIIEIGGKVDAILVDLSSWGESLVWELETLTKLASEKLVITCSEEGMNKLNQLLSQGDEAAIRVQQAILKKDVIVLKKEILGSSRFRKTLLFKLLFTARTNCCSGQVKPDTYFL